MALAIIIIICATALSMTIVITNSERDIRTKDSYWKAKYEIEHDNSTDILKLNREILDNTRAVIRTNRELHTMLHAMLNENKEEQTD